MGTGADTKLALYRRGMDVFCSGTIDIRICKFLCCTNFKNGHFFLHFSFCITPNGLSKRGPTYNLP